MKLSVTTPEIHILGEAKFELLYSIFFFFVDEDFGKQHCRCIEACIQ